jgi:hypothetical protein
LFVRFEVTTQILTISITKKIKVIEMVRKYKFFMIDNYPSGVFMKRLMFSVLSLWMGACSAELCPGGTCETPNNNNENPGVVTSVVGDLTREAFFGTPQNGWAQVERWSDPNPGFQVEDYPPDGRGNQTGPELTFFNSSQPASNKFLLYYAPGWDTNAQQVPVLLVHGANDNVPRAWSNPNSLGSFGCGALTCPNTGMMQALKQQGFKVFAIGFPHKQGDNFYWAEQIQDAVEIIKQRTGSTVVDVVGWSKGVTASRMYVSDVTQEWGTPYQNDVRKLILLGGPNGGFDYIFRYGWNHNFGIAAPCGGKTNAPMPHTSMTCFGLSWELEEQSIYTTEKGNFYPGQKQMLARWDGVYPVPPTSQDYFTTYYGGVGFFTESLGIDLAIAQGSLIAPIQEAQSPAAVKTYLLCGSTPNIPGIPNEISGPSDGVVFIDSCLDDQGVTNVADTAIVSLNHLQLGWKSSSTSKVATWLKQ